MQGHEFSLEVRARIPPELDRLGEIAEDLWYSWHRPARALFAPIDPALWRKVGHNPKLFLHRVDQRKLDSAARDQNYMDRYQQVLSAFDAYRQQPLSTSEHGLSDSDLIAYLCAEYGLDESLHIYSGGLGILAGHHCKAASDLRLPMVAVGLLYRAGYFSQAIDDEGNQIAHLVESRFDDLPIRRAVDADGEKVEITIPMPGREVRARVWLVRVGHVRVYLLDTDVADNDAQDRRITYQLYDSDRQVRLQQEWVLGVGGVRAIRRLGLAPTVWHLNEGHPAFCVLERVREMVAQGFGFDAALEAVAAATVFTTHTPVPAGHDRFTDATVTPLVDALLAGTGLEAADVTALGRMSASDSEFNMTTFAIRGSRHHNGVSDIHGRVSASLCAPHWPDIPAEENPMGAITNGVHIPTVLFQDWVDLFDRQLGVDWRNHLCDRPYWKCIDGISDQLFWSVKQSIKSKMLGVVREALLAQYRRNQMSAPHMERMLRFTDPEHPNILIIGFARRFATYKRATLLFEDLDWLRNLVDGEDRPVVFLFAGKAHPADGPGQQMLKRVHEVGCLPEFLGRVLLVENYDLAMARHLVAGVDVWLNTPVHTQEASGTSGMKAAVNGTINLSVSDGWWAEGFEGDNGWAILPSPHDEDPARRDKEDARTLYEILQDHVIPLYYQDDGPGHSAGWVSMAKRAMASTLPRFNMVRVVEEYARELYAPAAAKGRELCARDFAGAQELAVWRGRVDRAWSGVSIRPLDGGETGLAFGDTLDVQFAVRLGGLAPEDVKVELLLWDETTNRPAEGEPRLADARTYALATDGTVSEDGEHRYRLALSPESCGRLRYRIRMYPHHPLLSHPFELGRMIWA